MDATNVVDIYPLSPMQQGMLFHTLYEPTASTYTDQWTCRLTGPLDEEAFLATWDAVVARHDVFRTSFVWRGIPEPVQVVHGGATVPVKRLDWRGRDPGEIDAAFEELLEGDRAEPFDLARAPLMRLALVRVADDEVRFLWTFHHLLLDGWCQGLVLQELVTRYEATVIGRAVDLPPARQFGEYIGWLSTRNVNDAEEFWRDSLAGVQGSTPVNIEKTQAAQVDTTDQDYAALALSEADTEAVLTAAQRQRVTPNLLVQAALALVLSRYSGQSDVVLGVTVAGRPPDLPGADEIVGMFINTVPVRAKVYDDVTVGEWLADLQRAQVRRQAYEYEPLADVQRWSDVKSPARLFDVVLVPQYPMDFGDVTVAGVGVSDARMLERTNYPLTIVSFPGKELTLAAAHATERYENEAVQRLLGHVAVALKALAGDPGRAIGDISILAPEEERQVLVEWNQTEAPYPQEPLHVLIEHRVARVPDAVAVVSESGPTTYGELNERANRLAHRLRGLGVGADIPVAICVERSADMVVAVLGVMKAGGAYVPLDSLMYPPERIALILEDTAAPVVVCQESTRSNVPPTPATVVSLDGDPTLSSQPADNPPCEVDLDNLAYVLYTSGSTGVPKGVLVPHRGLANLVAALQIIEVGPDARVLQFAPLSFDISVGDIILALTTGATLCLATLQSLLSPESLVEQLREQRITNIQIVPSILSLVPVEDLPDLETALVGAEPCPADLVARWASGRRFFNVYGPTETTICATYLECSDPSRMPPIGKPIPNGRIYLLDGRGRAVPVGVPGEIYIGGVGVARGYLNRPDLTAECFLDDPFDETPGARMYRTGDLARFLPDGNIEFLGRIDDQVKVRGHRVELGEIESVLSTHPDVRECAVAAFGEGAGKRLVAYVVPDVEPPAPASLQEHLERTLPQYMIPTRYIVVDGLPLTPNGKIDRASLPDPDGSRPELANEYVAPRDQLEETLAGFWADALGLTHVGVTDNFFELGGQSLMAAQVVGQVEAAFGVSLPLVELFESPTVETVARLVRDPGEGREPVSYYAASKALDLDQEGLLEADIRPASDGAAHGGRPQHVFLTGASTFVGSFVLAELLRRTDALVTCLVAAPGAEDADERLRNQLAANAIDVGDECSRVRVVPGSLTRPLLGLSAEMFAACAAEADLVLHCGEVTDLEFLPYAAVRAPNVVGTKEAIRLACDAGAPFHLLSSLSAVPLAEIVAVGTCPETESRTYEGLPTGYAQSKWVAERLAREAERRGLPVAVYRVGEVLGHSATGVVDATATTTRTILSSIDMGQMLAVDLPIVLTPVDFVAAAIVHLACQSDSAGKTFNLTDLGGGAPPTPRQIGKWLKELGYPVRLVSPLKWRRTVAHRVASGDEQLLLAADALADVHEPSGYAGRAAYYLKWMRDARKWERVVFASDNARRGLEGSAIECPPVDRTLLGRYLRFCEEQGLLEVANATV